MFRHDDDDDARPPSIGSVVRFECMGLTRVGRVIAMADGMRDTFVVEFPNKSTIKVSACNATKMSPYAGQG